MNKKIEDKNLERIIKIKMATNNYNSIDQIEDICIQDINLMDNRLNIDLTEITKLTNLKSLSLKFFTITDEEIKKINDLNFLESIDFSLCEFETKKPLINHLNSVTIYNCKNFDISILENNNDLEYLSIIHSGIIDVTKLLKYNKLKYLKIGHCVAISISKISSLENLEKLYLNHLELQNNIDITSMKKLRFISLSGSTIQHKEEFIKDLQSINKKLIIEFRENDLPIE